jgi:prophage regulatory protein
MSTIDFNAKPEYTIGHHDDRFLRLPEVLWRVGLSRSCLYRMVNNGTFPRQIKINRTTVVWSENEIADWMDEQKTQLIMMD